MTGARRSRDKAAARALAVTKRSHDSLQPDSLSVIRYFARHADVIDRWHVDDEASRQGDVRSDARALLGDRLLGDLNENLLAFMKKVADRWSAAAFGPTSRSEIRLALIRSSRVW